MGRQLTFADRRTRDGNKRKRPGRKPAKRSAVAHAKRPKHSRWNPLHLTVRAKSAPWSLRSQLLFAALEKAFALTRRRDFRIAEYSVQKDHLHLVGEAENADALARGMKSFLVRATRFLNQALGRERGSIWQGRYHRSDLTTPRQVRTCGSVTARSIRWRCRRAMPPIGEHRPPRCGPDGVPALDGVVRDRPFILRQGHCTHRSWRGAAPGARPRSPA